MPFFSVLLALLSDRDQFIKEIGSVYRISLFKNPKYLVHFLVSEAIALFLIAIFSLPIGILLFQSIGKSIDTRQEQFGFVVFVFLLVLILFTGWNLVAWIRAKKMSCLSHLLD